MYIISDQKEKHFLHQESNKSYSITTDRRQAYKWNTFSKANNVLTSLPRSLSFYTDKWKIIFDKPKPTPIIPSTPSSLPKSPPEPVQPTYTSSSISTQPSSHSIKEDISSFRKKIQEEIDLTFDQLSHYDKEKEDVLHYIEFNNLNACQGYKIYNLLHEIMNDRRAAKDKIKYLQNIITNLDSAKMSQNTSRTYTPRALPTLFTNGI